MSTTLRLERIDMVLGSKTYQDKVGKQPRHLSNTINHDEYDITRVRAPKHRKQDPAPKHRRWSIEQY